MKLRLCALILAGFTLPWPATGLHAEEKSPAQNKEAKNIAISKEDRQVIENMQLLALMDMLKDMDVLAGNNQAVPEDKQ
jgi:hypothetical protein